ncbi:MAG: MFS transporter [Zymomonas mobilis subsp. pomaceae]|uniref:Major facilitator superfamily MFS_1 n=1 Tax=Zymomonas mobilis subsp. pomaceae (strain ATCC 29192 / DSM 22645 / JCM 10191 / CCUG 17912 / NBRC 13757 / NCIMB 11200 / NRRL B-4491 / Barker I) TaxID=579138 RepID=F8ETE9_ZYMMT|nr:MFS transporter [Zymomonas mobilis]AEI37974.1 major facilitator superfamily MFS_1 [Zymomonas mobilis subsp. pomaceae ATCC 29192]MDX5949342.1 MFS transporter [Zymomonas mobilis subsp. pomaceae]GEB89926.1 hexuronate transporter [Zymomonas mobilis subsp. pomaceae]
MLSSASPIPASKISLGFNHQKLVMIMLILIGIAAYADRQIIALLKPVLDREFGWKPADYALISSYSQAATAFSMLASGWIVDRLGVRVSLSAGVAGWSLSTAFHGLVNSLKSFLLLRVSLGTFEGICTPATMKAIALRFERKQRGRLVGLIQAGHNIAAMVTPLMVAGLFPFLGWRGTIITVGLLGLICAALWFLIPQPTDISTSVKNNVSVLTPEKSKRYRRIITGFALGKFLTDFVLWFLMFWLPDILHRHYGLNTVQLGLPVATIYGMAAIGCLLGGYIPPILAQKWQIPLEVARRRFLAVTALLILPIPWLLYSNSLLVAIALFGIALAAHQAFATNLFAFAAEWLPSDRVGRASGIGAFCGNISGALGLRLVGHFANTVEAMLPIFLYCSFAFILGWLALTLIAPYQWLAKNKK